MALSQAQQDIHKLLTARAADNEYIKKDNRSLDYIEILKKDKELDSAYGRAYYSHSDEVNYLDLLVGLCVIAGTYIGDVPNNDEMEITRDEEWFKNASSVKDHENLLSYLQKIEQGLDAHKPARLNTYLDAFISEIDGYCSKLITEESAIHDRAYKEAYVVDNPVELRRLNISCAFIPETFSLQLQKADLAATSESNPYLDLLIKQRSNTPRNPDAKFPFLSEPDVEHIKRQVKIVGNYCEAFIEDPQNAKNQVFMDGWHEAADKLDNMIEKAASQYIESVEMANEAKRILSISRSDELAVAMAAKDALINIKNISTELPSLGGTARK